MNNLEFVLENLPSEAIVLDGLNDAIVGTTWKLNNCEVLVYSVEKILEILRDRDGMDPGGALEFYDYNILGTHYGDYGPVFLNDRQF